MNNSCRQLERVETGASGVPGIRAGVTGVTPGRGAGKWAHLMLQDAAATSARHSVPNPTNPSVSVITPAYNTARYLGETVEAVLKQSWSDFELLIVDDGSTDETPALARALAARDRRLRVLTGPNRGPAAARNTAMAMARGRFFALLDSDDIWTPEYLAEQLRLLENCATASIVTANAINLGGPFDGQPLWPATSGVRTLTLQDIIEREDSVCIMSVFRREVFETIGGFDPLFTGNEDYEFWIRAACAGFLILQNRQPLGAYRRRDSSLSSDEVRMLKGILRVLKEADGRLADLTAARAAARRQIRRFQKELVRAELRASIARLGARWPELLLWVHRIRRAVNGTRRTKRKVVPGQ
jgi:teichuronic acid biosynthesis glycosyltransferase TuaG